MQGLRVFSIACAVLAFLAACVALYATLGISMRDSLDTMAEDEKRIAFWNGLGASMNVVATALFVVAGVMELIAQRSE